MGAESACSCERSSLAQVQVWQVLRCRARHDSNVCLPPSEGNGFTSPVSLAAICRGVGTLALKILLSTEVMWLAIAGANDL